MKSTTLSVNEVSLLTDCIEQVVRALIKLIIGKISLERLQQLVQNVFVEEAENTLRERQPGRDVPLTKLALLTGLDTRRLARIRNNDEYRKPIRDTQNFISTITPAKCVTDLWRTDARFLSKGTGKPRMLQIYGEGDSFETVVKDAVKARGITISSMIDTLVDDNQAEIKNGKKIKLRDPQPLDKQDRIRVAKLFAGLNAVSALLSTVNHNVMQSDDQTKLRYQQSSWTHRLPASRRAECAEDVRHFLEHADSGAREVVQQYEEKSRSEHQITAGVGFFYFESP